MISALELVAKIKAYHPNLNENLVQKAYVFSKTAHGNQKRQSGDPYFSHPLAVAEILTELKLDQSSIITALLHDVVEDTSVSLAEIEENFGDEVARLVDGVTKLGKIKSIPHNDRIVENLRKLTLAMSQDIRVLLIKLADRLHNMRTLSYVSSKEKRILKARESLDIYAPLAGRIGLNSIKEELEELSFAIIDPENRNHIVEKLNEIREKRKDLIVKIIDDLSELLKSHNIEFQISGREKKPYSIWLKMKRQNAGFHNLHDIMAFRIIVKDVTQCYATLGIINSTYNMIPRTFVDYISTPKENGYQSLHLAILGPFNKKIEIQIRDKKMHEVANYGLAAHWFYKENSAAEIKKEMDKYLWIRELISLFENSSSASEALDQYKLEIHNDEVFCFTPNGDIFNLPYGATAIDFAYAIHSEIGNSCISAKINGAIAPLRQKLENGDQVEIFTDKKAKPSVYWLQFVVTNKAKTAIKHFLRHEKFEEYSNLGKAILSKFFVAKELEISDKILEKILPIFHRKTVADLYVRVAEGAISRQEILKALYPEYREEAEKIKVSKKRTKQKENNAMPIEGLMQGMAMHFGGCCNPIPGDAIVGVINTGTGITIHNKNCRNLKNLAISPQRLLEVYFKKGEGAADRFYSSKIRMVIENSVGSLATITEIISRKQINISSIKTINRSADYIEIIIDVDVMDLEHLEELISAVRISRKVIEVERITMA